MKRLFNLFILGGLLSYVPIAQATEAWVEVTTNRAGDRILVDQNSIQREDDQVSYWEYRDMRQPNASIESTDQPVYGMMIYRSVDCAARASRMQRLVLFNQDREVIRRINYEDGSNQPLVGNNAETTIRYVCDRS